MAKVGSKKSAPIEICEQTLWDAADKMRGNLEAGEYERIVISRVFLKCVSERYIKRCGIQLERG